jgi:hypothetical protein
MGHAPSLATKIASQIASPTTSQTVFQDNSPSRRQNRKSLFALILDALHHSRRLQSKRALRQFHHLIDQADHARSGDDGHVDR